MPTDENPSTQQKIPRWMFLLILAVLGVYTIIGINIGFLSDDFAYLKTVHGLSSFSDYFYFIAKPLGTSFEWRPLTGIVWIIETKLFGTASIFFHLVHAGFLATCSWLLYKYCRLITTPTVSGLTVLLFLLMPFHTENVFWIADMTDLLAVIGVFATVLIGIQYLRTSSWRYISLASLVFFLGITGKEIAVAALPILLVTDFVTFGRFGQAKRKRLVLYGVLLGTILFSLALRSLSLGGITGITSQRSLTDSLFSPAPYKALISRMLILFNLEAFTRLSPQAVALWVENRKYFALIAAVISTIIIVNRRHDKKLIYNLILAAAIVISFTLPQTYVLQYIPLINLQHGRFLFAPSIGVALGLALLLIPTQEERRHLRYSKIFCAALICLLFVTALFVNTKPWLSAAKQRDIVLEQLIKNNPDIVAANSRVTIYLDALPEDVDGAFLFHDDQSFGEALQQQIQNKNVTIALTKKNPVAQEICRPVWQPNRVCLRWTGDTFYRDPATGGLPE